MTHKMLVSKEVGLVTNNVECDVAGIALALQNIAEQFPSQDTSESHRKAFILSDCQAAIDIVCLQSNVAYRTQVIQEIWKYLHEFERNSISVKIAWCPGHCGIDMNELADIEAKKAVEILSQREQAPDNLKKIKQDTTKKLIREHQIQQWQKAWDNAVSGRHTKDLIPSVRTKILWASQRCIDMSYARMLTGSTNLNDYLFKMKYSDTPNCECEEARETIEHYLMECSIHNEYRETMMEQIREKWMKNMRSGCLNINLEVLLAPNSTKLISREMDDAIKKALFSYICATGKSL